ncbi:hypothetical protein HanIR_Chr14g0692061 [Helianthus annuus]|nr:hypothetical protein HanIR_Chr14g0692061 [Helianthus annuus]
MTKGLSGHLLHFLFIKPHHHTSSSTSTHHHPPPPSPPTPVNLLHLQHRPSQSPSTSDHQCH